MISNINSPTPFVFIHANKTGGNSINKALENYGFKYPNDNGFTHESINFPHSQHWTLKELSLVVDIKKYYTFSISRNPWDRVVSYYRKNVCNPQSPSHVDADFNDWVKMAFVDRVTPEYQTRIDNRYSHKGPQYCREHDGVRNIEECYYYMSDKKGSIGVDFVIEFSTLEYGFSKVLEYLGLELPHAISYYTSLPKIKHMRSGIRTHRGKFFDIKSYHEMYNDESINIIEKTFSNDISIFKYKYE